MSSARPASIGNVALDLEFCVKPVPPLHKMRSVVSHDGRIAQFFLLFKGGQNAGFSIPFHKIGLFLTAVKSVAKIARERLSRASGASEAETTAGLSDPARVSAIAIGNNAETGEILLWIETVDNGPFSFELSSEAVSTLSDALRAHEHGFEVEAERPMPVLQFG